MISELQEEIIQILKVHSKRDEDIVAGIALEIGILFEQLPYCEEPNIKDLSDFLRTLGLYGLAGA